MSDYKWSVNIYNIMSHDKNKTVLFAFSSFSERLVAVEVER